MIDTKNAGAMASRGKKSFNDDQNYNELEIDQRNKKSFSSVK